MMVFNTKATDLGVKVSTEGWSPKLAKEVGDALLQMVIPMEGKPYGIKGSVVYYFTEVLPMIASKAANGDGTILLKSSDSRYGDFKIMFDLAYDPVFRHYDFKYEQGDSYVKECFAVEYRGKHFILDLTSNHELIVTEAHSQAVALMRPYLEFTEHRNYRPPIADKILRLFTQAAESGIDLKPKKREWITFFGNHGMLCKFLEDGDYCVAVFAEADSPNEEYAINWEAGMIDEEDVFLNQFTHGIVMKMGRYAIEYGRTWMSVGEPVKLDLL